MTQVVGTVFDSNTTSTTHSITVPSGVTTAMTGLFVIGTGSSTAVTTNLSRSGSTFTKLDERNAVNTRVAVWTGTNLTAGNTVTLAVSSAQAVTVAHYYQDDYTFNSGSLSAAIRSSSTNTTTSGSVTTSSGQRVVAVGVERTTTATTLSSVTSSGGESVSTISYGEGTGSAQASAYAGSFVASAAASRTATLTYSNSSGNGYAALILTTPGSGGGSGGGGSVTPGQAHNIGKAGGKNHFNLGKGLVSGHVDITENALEAGHVDATHYYLTPDGTEVVMAVDLDGGTTSANTQYPRMEYRELQPGGSGDSDTPKAAWDGTTGDHILDDVHYRVMALPPNKPEVVVGQIHGPSDDTAKIKWVGRTPGQCKLVATYGDDDYQTYATGLSLGVRYSYHLRCKNGAIQWWHNGQLAVEITDAELVQTSGNYFKFGTYAQTNELRDSVSDGPVVVNFATSPTPVCWHTGYAAPTPPAGVPTVSAGPDATVTAGATFGRTATEASASAITSRAWTILSGPAGATPLLVGWGGNDGEDVPGATNRLRGAFMARDSWADLSAGNWLDDTPGLAAFIAANPTAAVMFGVPLVPHDSTGPSGWNGLLDEAVSGARDSVYTALGHELAQHTPGTCYARLWWEFNVDSEGSINSTKFKNAWARAVPLIRAGFAAEAPSKTLKIVYNSMPDRTTKESHYPGTGFVDVVSYDVYGKTFGTTNQTKQFAAAQIAGYLSDLAVWGRSLGKPVGLDEWGNWQTKPADGTATNRGFGDWPEYITQVFDWAADPNNNVNHLCYFNEPGGDVGITLDDQPLSRQVFVTRSQQAVTAVIDNDASLAWTPTVAGFYTLRYSATNASGTGTDDLGVTVVAGEPGGGGTGDYVEEFLDGVPWPVVTRQSTVVSVSNGAGLSSALSAAASGQRITLASGSYTGTYTLSGKSNVTIQASTLGGPTFGAGSQLTIKDCTNVWVEGLNWTTDSPIEAVNIRGTSRNVRVTQCTIGPSSSASSSTSSGQYIYISDTAELIRIDYNLLRNKGTAGNNVKVYGNDTTGQVNKHILVDHNILIGAAPETANGKEPARHGVSTMSKSMSYSTYCRNYVAANVAEPEVFSGKAGGLLVYGNTFYRNAGGGVLRHGTDCVMADNYFIDGNNTTASAGLKSGGIRFYDSGHVVAHNYLDGIAGTGFQASLLIDRGDAEGSSTALANHWRVIDAEVDRNVIVNSATPIVVWNGSQYSLNPSDVTVTDNITAGTTQAGPIVFTGGAALVNSPAPSGNQHFATPGAAGLVQDGDGIWRKSGYGPRLTYIKQSDVGPGGATYDTDRAGTVLGATPVGVTVNAGADAQVLFGSSLVRTATETGSGITARKWTLESGPGVVAPTTPPAANLYVATTGSDAAAGTSSSAPKRTIGAALAAASAGQIISVAAGTYSGNLITSKGGSAGGYITIRSETKHGATIYGNGGTTNESAVEINHQYLRFQDFEVTGEQGVRNGFLVNASNVQIVGCRIHTICQFLTGGTSWQGGAGIDFTGPTVSNVVIDGNTIHDIGLRSSTQQLVHGIYCGVHATNGRITNNLIYECEDFGVHPYDETEASGWQVVNNTIVGCGRGILQAPNGVTRNNIVFNVTGRHYDIRGSGNVLSNNMYGGTGTGSTTGTGVVSANPLFVNSSTSGAGDFRLQPTSPAINAGTATDAPTTDIAGTTRPQGSAVDMGAYEASAATGGETSAGAVLSTTATVSFTPLQTGSYLLRYAATHPAGTSTDDITVTAGTGGGSTAAPTFVAAGATNSGESNTMQLPAPGGVLAGDFELAVLLSAGAEQVTAPPAGWALIRQVDVVSAAGDPGGPCTAWLYSSTSPGTGAAVSWTKSGSRVWHGVRLAWHGQSALGATAFTAETTAGTSHETPSVTPVQANSRVVGIVAADYLNAGVGPFTPPAGWTERYDQTVTSGTENESITVADVVVSATSTSGTFTSARADQCAVFAVVLEGPVAAQVVVLPGIGPVSAVGDLTVTRGGSAQTVSLPPIVSHTRLGRFTVTAGAGGLFIQLRGIPPR